MTITVDLSPETQAQLGELIARREDEAARLLLADALGPTVETLLREPSGTMSSAEFESLLDQLADAAGPNLPPLSDAAVTREGIYGDHP